MVGCLIRGGSRGGMKCGGVGVGWISIIPYTLCMLFLCHDPIKQDESIFSHLILLILAGTSEVFHVCAETDNPRYYDGSRRNNFGTYPNIVLDVDPQSLFAKSIFSFVSD